MAALVRLTKKHIDGATGSFGPLAPIFAQGARNVPAAPANLRFVPIADLTAEKSTDSMNDRSQDGQLETYPGPIVIGYPQGFERSLPSQLPLPILLVS